MIYFDNAATTRIHPEVVDAMLPYLREEFGNPSGKYYTLATSAKVAVETARESVASLVGCQADEVIFTSGSTESNNLILKGVTDYHARRRIITSKVEHPSVLDTVEYLESRGFQAMYLHVDRYGRVDPNTLLEALKSYDSLNPFVSIIWGNNELGTLNDIHHLASIAKEYGALFHTDATQVVGKHPVSVRDSDINFLSLSAHKIHGPKGIGACIIRKDRLGLRTPLTPLMHGGGQESDYRSGTLCVHNIVGFGKAAEIATRELRSNVEHLTRLEHRLCEKLTSIAPDVVFNNDTSRKIPGIINVRFPGINNEVLIRKLSHVVAISSGSACSSSKPSHVLKGVGLELNDIRSSVRISLSRFNTEKDVDEFIGILK